MRELHVVALSGGKDSTAMALRLAEVEPREYVYVCTPTGNELDEMFDHWKGLGKLLGKPIVPVMGGTLRGRIEEQNALPNFRARWCTRMLKIEPFAAWMIQQRRAHDRIVSYVGLRADEPSEDREGGDYSDIPGVEMRFPMREWGWGIENVWSYLQERGISIPERTDCALCFFQRIAEWWRLWKNHPDKWAEGEELERLTGHTFRTPGRDTWPDSMAGLRQRFEAGDVPTLSLKREANMDALKCRVCRL